MAPPTTTTARLTRGEAGRCARPLSPEPLKLEDGDHTGVEESPAKQRHTSSSTTTFARPPAERRHPSSSTTTSARPPAERRHPASATSRAAAPSHHRRPFQLGHRRGDGTIVAGTAHPSPALQAQYRPTTTTPLWRRRSAARRQGRRFTFKPGTDPTPPSLRRHRSATRRRGRRFTFKSGTDPPPPPSQDAAGPTTPKSCVEPES